MYIPNSDSGFAAWADNFVTLIAAAPATYGLEAADAAALSAQQTIWDAAYALCLSPSTKTKVAVADKDGEKVTHLQICRSYAAQIRANAGVSDPDKAALGLTIPDPTPTPVPPPTTAPVLNIPLIGSLVHMMTIVDVLTPTLKAKPQGVAGCIIHYKDGASPATDPAGASLLLLATKSDNILSVADGTIGQIRTYWGQWYNRKGEIGPMGAACHAVIASL